MAASSLLLEVATPDRLLVDEQVTEVEVPGADGALGVLPEHAPLLSELGSGQLRFTPVGKTRLSLAVSDGWVEVLPERVRVLAIRAEFGAEIDVARAEAALKRAEERLSKIQPGVDVARALNALHRAQARLAAARETGTSRK